MPQQEEWVKQGLVFRTTNDIIKAVAAPERSRRLPERVMMTFHPQRWNDNFNSWFQEYVFQTLKNQVKRIIVQ